MSPEDITVCPKLNLGRYKFQKMGRIGSREMYLIWAKFGITVMFSGLILITGSKKPNLKETLLTDGFFWLFRICFTS